MDNEKIIDKIYFQNSKFQNLKNKMDEKRGEFKEIIW